MIQHGIIATWGGESSFEKLTILTMIQKDSLFPKERHPFVKRSESI
jgi:hypothetical protein